MHASSYSHYPSSASAEVTVDSGRFWQIMSCQREKIIFECLRAAEKSAAFFVVIGFPHTSDCDRMSKAKIISGVVKTRAVAPARHVADRHYQCRPCRASSRRVANYLNERRHHTGSCERYAH